MPPRRNEKYKLPVPLPEGKVLDDTEGKQWVLGKKIGSGGFGLIYLAFPADKPDRDARHVIKVEYQENGPLFSELKFYQRAAKKDCIKKWIERKHLDYLGIPLFYGSGLTEFNGRSYRFMVIERLGMDLQKFSDQNGTFKKSTVLQLGIRMLDVLEYIHENEYVHGDIKAANLLMGYKNPHWVYLADYGLSYRYCPNGNHKQYQENPRKGHNGTIEFTSLDAHKGVALSRRSDVEILGYCMLRWLCGKLPWEQNLKDPVAVQTAKTNLAYNEKPDYQMLKKTLNPGGIPLGLLEFPTVDRSVCAPAPKEHKEKPFEVLSECQSCGSRFLCSVKERIPLLVNSQRTATKQVNQVAARLVQKVHCERSVESRTTSGPVQREKVVASVDNETAQEGIRKRQKYHESQELLHEVNNVPQKSGCLQFSNPFYETHEECTGPGKFSKSGSASWDMYPSTSGMGVSDVESSTGVWPVLSQLTLSEEGKAEVYYYGFIIILLLLLVCLALYFL